MRERPEINNATPNVQIVIDGADFTVDGQDISGVKPVTMDAGVVEIQDITTKYELVL